LAFVTGDDEAEWALVGTERLAVGGIHDQDGFGGEVVVEFGEGEDGFVAVGAFGHNGEGHAFASESGPLRYACFGEQGSDGDAVVLMHLVVVALGADGFAGEFFEVVEGEFQVLGYGTGDEENVGR
jgi:hypothetical protein